MMNHHLLANAQKAIAGAVDSATADSRIGLISSYDPSTHAVKVRIQPEDVETNWMPVGALGVGNGFGLLVGPNIGDMVMVEFAEADFESGYITGRYFNVSARAPAVPAGEIWALHASGSYLKFLTNGDVQMQVARNFAMSAIGTASYSASVHQFYGPVTTSATLTTGSDITDNTALGNVQTMKTMRIAYDSHGHPVRNVQGGSSTIVTDVPNTQV
jgi:phage baseplate assembly protein gpV